MQFIFFFDYRYQSLLPQKFSQLGPFIADGDVNGDGLSDFFVGGAFYQSGEIYTQQKNGVFNSTELVKDKKIEEDLGSLLFDGWYLTRKLLTIDSRIQMAFTFLIGNIICY